MSRKEFPRKVKAAAIARAAGHCERCKAALKTGEAEVDHILPDILGGEPVLANAQVLCRVCHAEKTAGDIRRTRKADRQRDKASGAVKPACKIPGRGSAPSPKPKSEKIDFTRRRSLFAPSGTLWLPGEARDHE